MPYYHVAIRKKSGTLWAFVFDLTREQVLEEIIKPFSSRRPFLCGDSPVEPSDVDHIRINETEAKSSQIIRKTRWRRIASHLFGRYVETDWEGYTDEWYIVHAGKNVTRNLIKGFEFTEDLAKTFATREPVFIVHGRDKQPAKELKEILESLGIHSIVLQEEPSKGKTVVEKLEEYADKVGYVFVVLTPDDMGLSTSDVNALTERRNEEKLLSALKARPRQNVIFEFGYFAGKLGRNRVCYMQKGNPELPSDIKGLVYIPFQRSLRKSKAIIIKELKAAGYELVKNSN